MEDGGKVWISKRDDGRQRQANDDQMKKEKRNRLMKIFKSPCHSLFSESVIEEYKVIVLPIIMIMIVPELE